VKVGFRAGYPELPAHAPIFGQARAAGALGLGQWGTELHAALEVAPSDLVLVKHRLGAAGGGPGGPRPRLPVGAREGCLRGDDARGARPIDRVTCPPGFGGAGGRSGRSAGFVPKGQALLPTGGLCTIALLIGV
jgi:hypothetical protein